MQNKIKYENALKFAKRLKKYVFVNELVTIEDLYEAFPEAKGNLPFILEPKKKSKKTPALYLWENVSQEFIDVMTALTEAGDLFMFVANPKLYKKRLKYPPVKNIQEIMKSKTNKWVPTVFTVDYKIVELIKQGKLAEATNRIPIKAMVLKRNYIKMIKDKKSLHRTINLYATFKFLTKSLELNHNFVKVFVQVFEKGKEPVMLRIHILMRTQFNYPAIYGTIKAYVGNSNFDFWYRGYEIDKDNLIVKYFIERE